MALLTACEPPKAGGLTAGTPPTSELGPASHTAGLPLPSGRDVTIWKSGRMLGSTGSLLNVTEPTVRPLMPGLASR